MSSVWHRFLGYVERLLFSHQIKRVLLVIQVFLVLLPVFVFILYSYSRIGQSMLRDYQSLQRATMNQAYEVLNVRFDQYDRLVGMIRSDETVMRSLRRKKNGTEDVYLDNQAIRDRIVYYLLTSSAGVDVLDVACYPISPDAATDGAVIFSLPTDQVAAWEDEGVVSESALRYFRTNDHANGEGALRTVSTLRSTFAMGAPVELLGYLRIDFRISTVNSRLARLNSIPGQAIYVADADNAVLYASVDQQPERLEFLSSLTGRDPGSLTFHRTVVGGQDSIVAVRSLGNRGRTLVSLYAYDRILTEIRRERRGAAFLFGAVSTLGLFLVYTFSTIFSRRINRLVRRMDNVGQSIEPTSMIPSAGFTGNDEIAFLNRKFTFMMRRLSQLIHEKYLAEINQRRLELNRLQEQINPHFLYNSLEIVSSMASLIDADDIESYVQKLSKILRYNISSTIDETVTLSREVAVLGDYVYIQKIRFKDLFEFRVEMDSNAESVEVPKFILQPLVENSIHHGLKDSIGGGEIRLYGKISDDTLILTIYDNGVGMSDETAAQLNRSLEGSDMARIGSIGMANVADRLRLHFGARARMRVKSTAGKCTRVDIFIPLESQATNYNKDDISVQ